MARPKIRTIKPEFATDGDMLRLSDSCSLFFILLWNFCDDEGKHALDLDQLAAELGGRWHKGKLKLFVSCLIKSGQLRVNSTSTHIQVVQWSHQKIDRPIQPKVKAEDLEWVEVPPTVLWRETAREVLSVSDRIVSDRIVSDRTHLQGVENPTPLPAKTSSKKDPSKNIPTWEAYRDAYGKRWGEPPIRNASVNAKIAQFVDRVGIDDAPHVAEFFLTHNDAFYVKSMHPVGLMLRDAEKLRTEWATGSRMTGSVAREVERRQHNSDSWDEAARILNDRRKA